MYKNQPNREGEMSNMTQLTKEQLESKFIAAVKSIMSKENDSAYMRGYANGIQEALGINDSEMRELVREA